MNTVDESAFLRELAGVVVKNGVGVGTLPAGQRPLALGCVWACLPAHVLREPEVNLHLRQALAGPACWLATDHVELRRWLVDSGWLLRDGFGHAYQRVAPEDLPPPLLTVGTALAGLDIVAWVQDLRQRQQDVREARRAAWAKPA